MYMVLFQYTSKSLLNQAFSGGIFVAGTGFPAGAPAHGRRTGVLGRRFVET